MVAAELEVVVVRACSTAASLPHSEMGSCCNLGRVMLHDKVLPLIHALLVVRKGVAGPGDFSFRLIETLQTRLGVVVVHVAPERAISRCEGHPAKMEI